MNINQILDWMEQNHSFRQNITAWKRIEKRDGKYEEFPGFLDERLVEAYKSRGIKSLYSHQAQAVNSVRDGHNITVVTPTASGKTACYNIPVLNTILQDDEARALYIFPTKALSQDQMQELYDMVSLLDADIKTYTYNGDTPPEARKSIRRVGHIVITNPDMLHTAILPHHTKWVKLFSNLRYIVIDEIHQYRGVFGSHFANVLRRLRRVSEFYGSNPTFISCSATIKNPGELSSKLINQPVKVIDDNGAPSGERHFILYNPPVINKELGIRRSYALEARKLASLFINAGIQTITFTRSRLFTELLTTYLREEAREAKLSPLAVRGYRGGYLPRERRQIEQGLREGTVRGVVSTNALELGIDIGQLDACVIAGYPGSVTSTWQQAGRAGRNSGVSAVIMIASSNPLDQYMVNHPEYFFEQNPEAALINPDNLHILLSHLKCAAFELPFSDGDSYGVETTAEILDFLCEEKTLRHVGGKYFWMSESFPAEDISLRSASRDNFVIVDTTTSTPRVIGEMDRMSALTQLHKDAIYLHEAKQYHVDRLDWEEKKAYVKQVDVDYYTDANLAVNIKVLDVLAETDLDNGHKYWGEIEVSALATIFKKIKLNTHENVGWGEISLPEQQFHTTAYFASLPAWAAEKWPQSLLQSGLVGLCNVLQNVAPLYLMADRGDIRIVPQIKSPFTGHPTLFIYDNYPGGIGFSERLYDLHLELLQTAQELIESCECREGCPSCVGPVEDVGKNGKQNTIEVINTFLGCADLSRLG